MSGFEFNRLLEKDKIWVPNGRSFPKKLGVSLPISQEGLKNFPIFMNREEVDFHLVVAADVASVAVVVESGEIAGNQPLLILYQNERNRSMKIAITAVGDNLDSMMDPRFGRAAYFLIVDSDSLEYQSFSNPNIEAQGGAGIQSAQFVLEKGAQAVITGSCGPNAYRVLEAAGISVFETPVKPVREQLRAYQEKQLPNIERPGKVNNKIFSVQKKGTDDRQSDGYSDSPHPPVGQMQKKLSQIEERLQEVNRRLEELEGQRGKKK